MVHLVRFGRTLLELILTDLSRAVHSSHLQRSATRVSLKSYIKEGEEGQRVVLHENSSLIKNCRGGGTKCTTEYK